MAPKKILLAFIVIPAILFLVLFQRLSIPSIISPLSFVPTRPPADPAPLPSPTPAPFVTIGLVGDLGLGRHITSTARSKNDFTWSFGGVSSWLSDNDFNLANLESPIIDPCPEGKTGTFTFCGDRRFLPQLSHHKFIFNLSNNHILNYGQKGLNQTYNFLDSYNIPYYYSHQTGKDFITREYNGISFGFLGYDFVTYPPSISQGQASSELITQLISQTKYYDSQVDWLIISLHWGNEYLPQAESWRLDLARRLVDAGADIIHGHHPHVVQPSEVRNGKPIFYSLGNFIFDQSWSYETSHTQIIRLTVSKTAVLDSQVSPVTIKSNSRPEIDPI